MKRERDHRPVVSRLAEHRALFGANADDFKGPIVDNYSLADGVDKRKQVIGNIRTNHANISGMVDVIRRHKPPASQLGPENDGKVGGVALNLRIHVFARKLNAPAHIY